MYYDLESNIELDVCGCGGGVLVEKEVETLSRIEWPGTVNEPISNMHLWVRVPEEIVLSCFQGVLFRIALLRQ